MDDAGRAETAPDMADEERDATARVALACLVIERGGEARIPKDAWTRAWMDAAAVPGPTILFDVDEGDVVVRVMRPGEKTH